MKNKIKTYFEQWMQDHKDVYWDLSDKLWNCPELGLEEYKASENIIKVLRENGFSVTQDISGMPTAFIAEYKKGSILAGFSCEFDALPGLSQDISSERKPIIENGPGHGCGHNILGVAAVYCAVALKNAIEKFDLDGSIIIFGSPAEEICIGKPLLGRTGRYKDVDFFLDWHPSFSNEVGYFDCPAYFSVKYHFKGRSAHGDMPWQGRSALDAALLQAHAAEIMREHVKPRFNSNFANTFNYTFPDVGPEIPNVIPDRASIWFVGRFGDAVEMEEVISRLDKCAQGASIATETSYEKEFITATHEMLPNKTLSEVVYKNLIEIGAPTFTEEEKAFAEELQRNEGYEVTGLEEEIKPFVGRTYGVTDSAEYSWNAPYNLFELTTTPGPAYHNWLFTAASGSSIGKKCLDKAAELLFVSAIDLILQPETIQAAKEELKERLKGRQYKCLIPDDETPDLKMNKETMEKYRAKLNDLIEGGDNNAKQ